MSQTILLVEDDSDLRVAMVPGGKQPASMNELKLSSFIWSVAGLLRGDPRKPEASPRWRVALCASVVLAGCGASRQGVPRQYAQARDTATEASLRNPGLAVPQVGEKMPVVPLPRFPSPPVAVLLATAGAAGGQAVINASESLDSELLERIDEALAECADMARAEVMLKHFEGRRPTHEECNEEAGTDSRGEPITRAMRLGVEQHRVALQCAEDKLKKLKPGGYSLSPRYRYNAATGKAEFIPREVVNELLRKGRGAELKGTLEPDIVLHAGVPHQVQATYDYKFPCMNTDKRSAWRDYPAGRAEGVRNQGALYENALKVPPFRVQPHLGVY